MAISTDGATTSAGSPTVPETATTLPAATEATSLPTAATHTAINSNTDTNATNSTIGYGNLLDLAELDGYLLSLMSSDLSEVIRYVYLTQKTFATAISSFVKQRNDGVNSNTNSNGMAERNITTSSSSSSSHWWHWQDVLAFITILASRGETPATRALGFELIESETSERQRPQTKDYGTIPFTRTMPSFWEWFAGTVRDNMDNNYSGVTIFRCKLFVYAMLRIALPRLYERIRFLGLEYVNRKENEETAPTMTGTAATNLDGEEEITDPLLVSQESEMEDASMRALAIQRRKLVIMMLFRWLDGAIIPSMKLALLLSFWAGRDRTHGGNLALWFSGLSFKRATVTNLPPQSASTALVVPTLFVLYAHRRWLQREVTELFWNRIGRSLITIHGETSDMLAATAGLMKREFRIRSLRWAYKLAKVRTAIARRVLPDKSSCDDDGRDATTKTTNWSEHKSSAIVKNNGNRQNDPCPLCGTKDITVPCKLSECCGRVVCYVCLWDHLAATHKHLIGTTLRQKPKKFPCPVCYQDVHKCERIGTNIHRQTQRREQN